MLNKYDAGACLTFALAWISMASFKVLPFFGLSIPRRCPDVPNAILNPRDTWRNEDEYDATAKKLTDLFNNNFNAFAEAADAAVVAAGPKG